LTELDITVAIATLTDNFLDISSKLDETGELIINKLYQIIFCSVSEICFIAFVSLFENACSW